MAAYGGESVRWPDYALAQITITAFHLMTHYANDYFDRHADARAVPTPYSGGSGVLVEGLLAPGVALRAALAMATVGSMGVVAMATFAERPVAALLGGAIGALAWSYSAPPLRLLGRGLGELDTALVVAILVPLCAFAAQGAALDLRAVASTLPAAAAMFAMMLAVEYPDIAADTAGGKNNLVVRLGAGAARPLGIAFVAAVYGALGLALAAGAPPAFLLCEAITLPLGAGLALAFARRRSADVIFDESLAARGVTFFFIVMLCGLLAFAAAPHGAPASATIVPSRVVLAA